MALAFQSSAFGGGVGGTTPDVEITAFPVVSTTATDATFTFTVNTGAAEYSLDGGAYAAASSPLTVSGLSLGAHTITIRSTTDTAHKQTFAWTVVASSGGGPVVVTNNVTTAEAIRDYVISLIRALTPTTQPSARFIPHNHERDGKFEAWCEAKGSAPFRRFSVRSVHTDRRPRTSNLYVEEHFLTLEMLFAYPMTSRTGKDGALDRDDTADLDRKLITQAVCVNGYANFVGAVNPNATPLAEGDPVSFRELAGVELLVITQTYRYFERTIP